MFYFVSLTTQYYSGLKEYFMRVIIIGDWNNNGQKKYLTKDYKTLTGSVSLLKSYFLAF